ncbi:hypothetical protein RF11_05813 [Thelohanellus kitauei]|uniref:Uncharacterized protein n=1 Tax=Thelohanellus kitauei TaxID=669202 RepID=A0A0C2MHG0_THEKT|nr:hypothetical protein RF11_05813 [Thelohanellus kitauei]
MKETTTSEDIFEFMENNLHKIVLPLHKMANITTDSSLSLIGKTVGLLKRMCDSVAEVDSNEEWIFLHDIIHQEASQVLSLNHSDVLYYRAVRWTNWGKIQRRAWDQKAAILLFLEMKSKDRIYATQRITEAVRFGVCS